MKQCHLKVLHVLAGLLAFLVLDSCSKSVKLSGTSETNPTGYNAKGLVAFWRFSDGNGTNAADSSDHGLNLALQGSPSSGSNYLTLNGANQYGDAGSNALAKLDSHDKTICAWLNPAGGGFPQQGIVDKSFYYPNVGSGGWQLCLMNNVLYWTIQRSSVLDNGLMKIIPGQWTFVAMTWHYDPATSESAKVRFYIDGLLNSESPYSAPENASLGAHLVIGTLQNNVNGITNCFNGSIRDLGIYDRVLSDGEIQANYASSRFTTNVERPDLLYYKMAEGDSTHPPFPLTNFASANDTPGTVHGSANNDIEWRTNVANFTNTALHFNGGSVYVDSGLSAPFDFTTNLFTINIWVCPVAENGFLLDKEDNAGANGWYLTVGSTYDLYFATTAGGTGAAVHTGASVLGGGAWNMVTCVRNSPTNVLIYVNGRQTATTGNILIPGTSGNNLFVGTDRNHTRYFDGHIWLTQIWNKPLQQSDVTSLYLGELPGIPWP